MAYRPSLSPQVDAREPPSHPGHLSAPKKSCAPWGLGTCIHACLLTTQLGDGGARQMPGGNQFTRGTAPHRKGPGAQKTVHFWSCLGREGRWDCKGPLGLSCREDSGEGGRAGRLSLKPRLKCSRGQSMRAMEALMHSHKLSVPFPTRKWS